MYYKDCLGFFFLCFPWPALITYCIPSLKASLPWGKICPLWPLATDRSRSHSCPSLFLRIPLQNAFQTFPPSPKLAAGLGDVKPNTPRPSHSKAGHQLTMVEMTFWFTDTAPFPCFQRTSDITRKMARAGLLGRGQHHEPMQEISILLANFPIHRKSCANTII